MPACALHVQRFMGPDPEAATVALLHGLGSSAEDWPLQVPALNQAFEVLAIDLPGHGQSPPPPPGARMTDLARLAAECLKQAGRPPIHLVGLSFGAVVALQIAVDAPELVRSLTLTNGFARLHLTVGGLPHALGRALLLLAGRMDWLGAWVAAGLFPEPEQTDLRRLAAQRISANSRQTYLRTLLAVALTDLTPRLGEVTAPTLILAGGRDTTVALQAKCRLHQGICRSRLIILPGSGHASPLDAPREFNRLLCAFLCTVEGRRDARP
jgi:3-oxoadipate enol-lactonase